MDFELPASVDAYCNPVSACHHRHPSHPLCPVPGLLQLFRELRTKAYNNQQQGENIDHNFQLHDPFNAYLLSCHHFTLPVSDYASQLDNIAGKTVWTIR